MAQSLFSSWEALEEARSAMESLREVIHDLIRDDAGALMGDYAWLRFTVRENDIIINEVSENTVFCYGTTFTVQTQDNESFEFSIPLTLVQEKMLQQ